MSLDEIIARAIPFTPTDCSIKKSQKERMRRELKGRIEEYLRIELLKEKESLKQINY